MEKAHPKIRIGIVGCGAVTEKLYWPVLTQSPSFQVTALVDKDTDRVRTRLNPGTELLVTDDYQACLPKVEALVIALPNHLHGEVAIDCLSKGIHCLVEKPMALTVVQCEAMIEAAQLGKAQLAVGLSKRFFHAHQFIKQAISEGILGTVRFIDMREGSIFNWPAASDFLFRKETGGGVLADTGPHTLDLLLWWMGEYEEVKYFDDSFGGVEADCLLRVWFKNGAQALVELSRTRNLRKTYQIVGDRATIEVGAGWADPEIVLKSGSLPHQIVGKVCLPGIQQRQYIEVMGQQLEDFAQSINYRRRPFVDGREGLKAIALIEECHRQRSFWDQPWLDPQNMVGHSDERH